MTLIGQQPGGLLNQTQNGMPGATVTVSSVFVGDNQRKKSVGDKPAMNQPLSANFNRKTSLGSKQMSVQNVSPI